MRFVLAIDEGTTGVRAHVFDESSALRGAAYQELTQSYPRPGAVEQDPEDIWRRALAVSHEALAAARLKPSDLSAIGICNQRATTLVWERASSRPVYPAIVWQDTRTADRIPELLAAGFFTNSMASAAKLEWILRHIPDGAARAADGALCFGTVDTWLLWKLTGGAVHATDSSNASCTTLYDPVQDSWDNAPLGSRDAPEIIDDGQLRLMVMHDAAYPSPKFSSGVALWPRCFDRRLAFDLGCAKIGHKGFSCRMPRRGEGLLRLRANTTSRA